MPRGDAPESGQPVVDEHGEELQTGGQVGYVPIEERGGAISVSEGDAGPVGAIAVLASAALRGVEREDETRLVGRTFGLKDQKDLDDMALARKVETEICRSAAGPEGGIDVSVQDGVVQLGGEVPSSEALDDLVERARNVAGVRGVESLLHVRG
jgi:osmotically-inducible protein OsmY